MLAAARYASAGRSRDTWCACRANINDFAPLLHSARIYVWGFKEPRCFSVAVFSTCWWSADLFCERRGTFWAKDKAVEILVQLLSFVLALCVGLNAAPTALQLYIQLFCLQEFETLIQLQCKSSFKILYFMQRSSFFWCLQRDAQHSIFFF